MEVQADCVAILLRLLEPPSAASDDLMLAMDVAGIPRGAAEQMALFEERTGDLTFDERQELFEETFSRNDAVRADRQRLVGCLERETAADAAELAPLLQRLRTQLLRDGNPYHHVMAAAIVLVGV